MKKNIENNKIGLSFSFIIFLIMFVFYYYIHPIVIYDIDDWSAIAFIRRAVPIWGGFDSIKVLPETLPSMVIDLFVFTLYPISNNYVLTITAALSTIISIAIAVYCLSFYRLINEKYGICPKVALILSFLYFLFHFLIYKNELQDNDYLFTAGRAVDFQHGLFPNIWNATIVLNIILHGGVEEWYEGGDNNYFRKGSVLLLLYLGVFSNIFCSITLIAYVGTSLLFNLFHIKDWKRFFPRRMLSISLIVFWLISLLYAWYDSRTSQVRAEGSGDFMLGSVMQLLTKRITMINKLFALLFIIVILLTAIVSIHNKSFFNDITEFIISGVLTLIYLILLCAMAGPGYFDRNEYWLSIMFYVFLAEIISMCRIINHLNWIQIVLPLLRQ